jgi:hypothetical protein
VKDAPRHEADGGVTPEQEDELRRHYAGETQDARSDATPAATAEEPAAREGADRDPDRDHDERAAALQRDHDADRARDSAVDRDHDRRDGDGDRDGDHDHTPEHAAGDVPPVPDIEEGQVLREERLVVRREEVPVDDDSSARHVAPPGDTPRI